MAFVRQNVNLDRGQLKLAQRLARESGSGFSAYVREALEHPQCRAIDMVVDVDHPDGGTTRSLGCPIHFDEQAPFNGLAAPHIGQHTFEVLREFGFEDAALQQLHALGVVHQHADSVSVQ